jgi:hypothetical protein
VVENVQIGHSKVSQLVVKPPGTKGYEMLREDADHPRHAASEERRLRTFQATGLVYRAHQVPYFSLRSGQRILRVATSVFLCQMLGPMRISSVGLLMIVQRLGGCYMHFGPHPISHLLDKHHHHAALLLKA